MGIQNNLKFLGTADCVVRVISCSPFWNFLGLEIRHGFFFGGGGIFGPGIFLGFVGSPKDFFGF